MADDKIAPYEPKPVPSEPKQMQLWRQILAYRDALATGLESWEDFFSRQRQGNIRMFEDSIDQMVEPKLQTRGETGVELDALKAKYRAEAIEETGKIADIEKNLQRSEAMVLPGWAELRDLDAEIEAHSPVNSEARGFNVTQLKKLAARSEKLAEINTDTVVHWIVLYLAEKKEKSPHTQMTRRTVETMLQEHIGATGVDLDALEASAREQRKEDDGTGRREEIAKRMLDLAIERTKK